MKLTKEQLIKEWQLLSLAEQLEYDGRFDRYYMAKINNFPADWIKTDRDYSKVIDYIKKENAKNNN